MMHCTRVKACPCLCANSISIRMTGRVTDSEGVAIEPFIVDRLRFSSKHPLQLLHLPCTIVRICSSRAPQVDQAESSRCFDDVALGQVAVDEAVQVELPDDVDDGIAVAGRYPSTKVAAGGENMETHLSAVQSSSASPASVTRQR